MYLKFKPWNKQSVEYNPLKNNLHVLYIEEKQFVCRIQYIKNNLFVYICISQKSIREAK